MIVNRIDAKAIIATFENQKQGVYAIDGVQFERLERLTSMGL
jgi:hypothetical protein